MLIKFELTHTHWIWFLRLLAVLVVLVAPNFLWEQYYKYQWHETMLAHREAALNRDRLLMMWFDCIDGKREIRMDFNDGVDWVDVKCIETDSNLYRRRR